MLYIKDYEINYNEEMIALENNDFDKLEKDLKEATEWIKEGLKDNSIALKSDHNDYITKLYKMKAYDKLHEVLYFVFMSGLLINYTKDNFKNLRCGKASVYGHFGECNECGENISYAFNGKEIVPVKLSENRDEIFNCKVNKTELEFEIDFPTGNLLCADSIPYMREVMEYLNLDEQAHTLNSTKGTYERIENYASVNMFHIYVGNTCPTLWLNNDTLAVGNSIEPNIEPDDEENELKPLGKDSKDIAFICTDLWWATIVDEEIYKSLLVKVYGEEEGIIKFNNIQNMKDVKASHRIKPGKYKCTYNKFSDDIYNESYNEPYIYCKLELVI